MYVNQSADTAQFAVEMIVRWWLAFGQYDFPSAPALSTLCDGGGSNGWRSRLWKLQIQEQLADRLNLEVMVCHYPKNASKWNPIEHRLFGPISLNWEGKPLRTLETMLAYIRRTTTQTGLQVSAFQVDQVYERGIKVEYDMQGRAYRQFDGDGNLITRIVYNANGSSTIYDANGNAETDTYDSHNVATRQVDQLNRAEDTVSSAASNFRPTSITNSAGQTLSMEWSADGADMLSQTNPDGGQTVNTYDALNNLLTTTDPLGNVTTYTYNGTLLISKTDALNHTTTYTYTPEGYLASETDPSGLTTSYTYNSAWPAHLDDRLAREYDYLCLR